MATTNIPKNAKRMAKFNFISSNYVSSVNTHANTQTPLNKLMEVLHDEITSKQGTYGAVLLVGGTTAYLEFKVEEDCRFWATSGMYSDSGGASGNELNIFKYNNELQTYQLFKTVSTTATEDWYVVCDLLTKGTYKIQAKGNYVQFNEFYFESTVENKTLILHDGEYKKWNLGEVSVASTNAVPTMTSNNTPSGKVTTSTAYDKNYEGWRVFNRNESDGWTTLNGVNANQWIQYEFPTENVVSSYSLLPFSDSTINLTQMPNTWRFEGSNDGSNWDILDSKSGAVWTSKNYKIFPINNNMFYRFYRLFIISNNRHTNISTAEIKIETKDLITNRGWSTVSSTLPTSTKFFEQGMDSLSVIDRTVTELEPLTMTNNEILGVGEIGKVFSKTIDLKKYFDIRSVRTEVK